jgi:threonine dehydratase
LQARVYDVAKKTPLDKAIALSQRLNNHIWLKREDLQPVFSFKIRGAYNRIAQFNSQKCRARGVIAASAGNHAQGVALSAARLGIRAVIVMPKTTPDIKVSAVRSFGAEVILHGSAFDDASQHAQHAHASRRIDLHSALRRRRCDCRSRNDWHGDFAAA